MQAEIGPQSLIFLKLQRVAGKNGPGVTGLGWPGFATALAPTRDQIVMSLDQVEKVSALCIGLRGKICRTAQIGTAVAIDINPGSRNRLTLTIENFTDKSGANFVGLQRRHRGRTTAPQPAGDKQQE